MITRIELTNFMSHKHTVIEPAAGLTVLIGPNNVGKSAIVAALQILCHNGNSTYVMRHGERECSVCVETDDGHVIGWRRKNSPSYAVDGQQFDRLGRSGVPDEVCKALRLTTVDGSDDDKFDVHFGEQKSPIFLLNKPAAAAQFFASSSDALRLVKVQRRHKAKLENAQRDKSRFEAESSTTNRELALLEPAVEISRRVEAVQLEYRDLLSRQKTLEHGQERCKALAAQELTIRRLVLFASALNRLAEPPRLAPLEPLQLLIKNLRCEERRRLFANAFGRVLCRISDPPQEIPTAPISALIEQLEAAEIGERRARLQTAATDSLAEPPRIADVQALSATTENIAGAAKNLAMASRRSAALVRLAEPPSLEETAELARVITAIAKAAAQLADHNVAADDAETDCAAAEADLRQYAAGQHCPVCGVELDPDRIVAHALAGVGAHPHD